MSDQNLALKVNDETELLMEKFYTRSSVVLTLKQSMKYPSIKTKKNIIKKYKNTAFKLISF